jgi:hypothetical protein
LKADQSRLVTPRESVYPVADPIVAARLGVSFPGQSGDTPARHGESIF